MMDDDEATEDEKPDLKEVIQEDEDDSATEDEEEERMLQDPIGDYKKTLDHKGGDDSALGTSIRLLAPDVNRYRAHHGSSFLSFVANKNLQEAIELLVVRGQQKRALSCLEMLRLNSIEASRTEDTGTRTLRLSGS